MGDDKLQAAHRCVLAIAALAIGGIHPSSAAQEMRGTYDDICIEQCRSLIRSRQLPDGLIRMRADADFVRGIPYFANMAAVALLEQSAGAPSAGDVQRVERWLKWYAAHQSATGIMHKYEGTLASYGPTEELDTTDTSASLYLFTLNRYRQARPDRHLPPAFRVSSKRAIDAVAKLVDPQDGLTWARLDYPVKYLMDNLLVVACMVDAAELFESVEDPLNAARAAAIHRGIVGSLHRFRSTEAVEFAWAVGASGKLSLGLDREYPHLRANIYAMIFANEVPTELWEHLRQRSPAESLIMSTRWYFAARQGSRREAQAGFRRMVLEQARALEASSCDVHEPALALLVLMDGPAL